MPADDPIFMPLSVALHREGRPLLMVLINPSNHPIRLFVMEWQAIPCFENPTGRKAFAFTPYIPIIVFLK